MASEYRTIREETGAIEYLHGRFEEGENGILSSAELIDPHTDSPFFWEEVIESVSQMFNPAKLCSFE